MKTARICITLLVLLLTVKCIAVWYGFDRLPLLSTNDEATFNDPAFWMAKGEGLVAKSLDGTLGMERVYAQFPPLYITLQALIFRLFSLSAFTLRGSNIFFFIAYICLLLAIFYHLKKHGIYDNFSVFWVSLILIAEPTIFSFCRMGRPESLGLFFAISAFLLLLSEKRLTASRGRWVISAILIGLSISAHFEMAIFYAIFAVLVGVKFRNKDRRLGLILLLLPTLGLIFIWITIYRAKSWDALTQFYKLYSFFHSCGYTRGFRICDLCRNFLSGSFRSFNQNGGFALILISFSWMMIFIRVFNNFKHKFLHPTPWVGWLFAMSLFAIIEFLVLTLYFGTTTQRIVTVFPVSLVGLGVAISHLRLNKLNRYILISILGLLTIAGLILHGAYLYKVHHEWTNRDPTRFSHIVHNIPVGKKIAAAFPIWLEFTKSGYAVRLIDTGVPYSNDSFYNPEVVNRYDIIILFSNHVFINAGHLSNKKRKTITVGGVDFTVFQNEEYI